MKSRLLAVFLFAAFSITISGCQGKVPPATPTEIPPKVETETPGPSETPVVCTPNNPPGLTITFTSGRITGLFQPITVNGKGFLPGESLRLIVKGIGENNSTSLAAYPVKVKDDGSFSSFMSLQVAEPTENVQVVVVHQRGVACVSSTPMP